MIYVRNSIDTTTGQLKSRPVAEKNIFNEMTFAYVASSAHG